MARRLSYVPLHSIIVTRDDKQIDALESYRTTGKAFAFTAEELDEIAATYATAENPEGSLDQALRAPSDEVDDGEQTKAPAASDKPAGVEKPAKGGSQSKDNDL